jgi:hypothetical protein
VVRLTPAVASGSAFAGWKGACSGSGSCVVTMSSDQILTATFDLPRASLTALGETYSTFAVGRSSTPLSGRTAVARHHEGTLFSFGLDQPAKVQIAIKTGARGRRVGRSCKPETHKLRHRLRCRHTVTVAALTRTGHLGLNKVAFSGRIAGRALKPGHYTAVFTAIDAAGASRPQSLGFTVARR